MEDLNLNIYNANDDEAAAVNRVDDAGKDDVTMSVMRCNCSRLSGCSLMMVIANIFTGKVFDTLFVLPF